MRNLFVPVGTFFGHVSTPTKRTTTTTKLLLGPLSRARGQKRAKAMIAVIDMAVHSDQGSTNICSLSIKISGLPDISKQIGKISY